MVEIVETRMDRVTKRMEYTSLRDAEKGDRGVNINLNHNEYHTRIVAIVSTGGK